MVYSTLGMWHVQDAANLKFTLLGKRFRLLFASFWHFLGKIK